MEERRGNDIVFCGKKMDSRRYDGPLWQFLKQSMLSHGSNIALVNPYTQEEWNYNRVVYLAECLSRGLQKLGLKQGESLCIVAPNSVQNALLILALLASGAIVHATNPASMPGEIRRQLTLTEAQFIVTVPELLASVEEAVAGTSVRIIMVGPRGHTLNYEDLLTLGTEDPTLPTSFNEGHDALASLLFSSGTTGLPKGVQVTCRSIRAWFSIFAEGGEGVGESDTAVLFLPFFHVYGQVVTLLSMLVYGVRLVIMSTFDMIDYLTFHSRYQATLMFTVPPVVIGLLNHPKTADYDLSHLRVAYCGAAPLGKETVAQFSRHFGRHILQGYGMTETMVATFETSQQYRAGSCGFPIPGMEFKIVDEETGKSLGVSQTGDLYMRGPLMMKGYHKNPQATADTIDPQGWLKTGDVGYFDRDGFLYIIDRRKELIKYKGEQVPPAMLEDVLLSHPAISDVCVVGKPDTLAGELPMAFVVKATASDLSEQEIKDFVAKSVPSFMQLRGGVEFRQQIPKTPSGKILRRLLRDEIKQKLKAKL